MSKPIKPAQPNDVIDPILIESISQLRDMQLRFREFNKNHPGDECIKQNCLKIEMEIPELAYAIANMARSLLITNSFLEENRL